MTLPLLGNILRGVLAANSGSRPNPHKEDPLTFRTLTIGSEPRRILSASQTRLQATLLLNSGSAKIGFSESLPSWQSFQLPREKFFNVDDPTTELWAVASNGGSAQIGLIERF
ncbi:hypothetical protein ES702_05107 [subsurface metagenome]